MQMSNNIDNNGTTLYHTLITPLYTLLISKRTLNYIISELFFTFVLVYWYIVRMSQTAIAQQPIKPCLGTHYIYVYNKTKY